MKVIIIYTLLHTCVVANMASLEQGSYVNPNPRQYENCEVQDLVQLSECCNDVLNKLDECKANDLACECCALQSMKQECYGLCPGNPSNNFLTTLFDDCATLNDVNACSLPFKKDDSIPIPIDSKEVDNDIDDSTSIKVKSKIKYKGNKGGVEEEIGFGFEEDEEDYTDTQMADADIVQDLIINDISGSKGNNSTNTSATVVWNRTISNSTTLNNLSNISAFSTESSASYDWNFTFVSLLCILSTLVFGIASS